MDNSVRALYLDPGGKKDFKAKIWLRAFTLNEDAFKLRVHSFRSILSAELLILPKELTYTDDLTPGQFLRC